MLWKLDPDSPPGEATADFVSADMPNVWYSAFVKWDGCIELIRYFNVPRDLAPERGDDYDQIHICDIDETIERLQALKTAAIEHFGADWGA